MFWKSSEKDEKGAAQLLEAIQILRGGRFLRNAALICGILNLGVWISVFLFPKHIYSFFQSVNEASQKAGVFILGIPLWLAFFAAYALFRLKFPYLEEEAELKSELMSSYSHQAHSMKRWRILIASLLIGVLNVFLLVLADLFLNE